MINKKISIITPTLCGGGAEKVAVNLANYYAEVGLDVDLVVFNLIGPYQSEISNKVNLVNLDVSNARYVLFKLRKYLKRNKFASVLSVIFQANFFVGLASIGLGLKSITFREANTLDAVFKKSKLYCCLHILFMKISYYQADNVIANSDDTKRDLTINKITNVKKIHVIRNPVLAPEYEKLKLEKVDEEWFLQVDNKVILSVGRLHQQKNFSFLISVFKDVYLKDSSTRLMIVGEGPEKDRLLNQVEKEGLSDVVKLVPFQNNIYSYYQSSDVFALTSDWEGFGNVLVEALSVGLPVVSTNCPGGPKMILEKEMYGHLIPIGDKESYVTTLLKLLKNSEKRDESTRYAKKFTVESVARDYLKVLEDNYDGIK